MITNLSDLSTSFKSSFTKTLEYTFIMILLSLLCVYFANLVEKKASEINDKPPLQDQFLANVVIDACAVGRIIISAILT